MDEVLDAGSIGIMTDLHANPLALGAVVDDARSHGVERWLVLGDVVAMGYDPSAVLEELAQLEVIGFVAGNTERYVLTDDLPDPTFAQVEADPGELPRLVEVAGSFAWTRGALAARNLLENIASFSPELRFALADGSRLLAVHSSQIADDGRGIAPDVTEAEMAALFPSPDAQLVVGGHTHLPTDVMLNGIRFVNPGSVSNPVAQDKSAHYAILRTTPTETGVELKSVAYDLDEARSQIEASSIPGRHFLLDRYFTATIS